MTDERARAEQFAGLFRAVYLIWLTAQGHEALRRDREVLSVDMPAGAMTRLPASQAEDLIIGLRARTVRTNITETKID